MRDRLVVEKQAGDTGLDLVERIGRDSRHDPDHAILLC
jgi:hypothetical protein